MIAEGFNYVIHIFVVEIRMFPVGNFGGISVSCKFPSVERAIVSRSCFREKTLSKIFTLLDFLYALHVVMEYGSLTRIPGSRYCSAENFCFSTLPGEKYGTDLAL